MERVLSLCELPLKSAHGAPVRTSRTHRRQVALRDYSRPRVQRQLHLGNLFVDVLHELNDEVDELVLQHGLGMKIGDQKGNVVALRHTL